MKNTKTNKSLDSEKIRTLNDIEARIIPENKPEAPKKLSGTTLNPAAAPFVKKDVRTTVINEQAEIFNKLYSQISANNQSNAMTANFLRALHQHNQTLQQQMNQRVLQQQAQFQQLRSVNSDLLKTPEAQVLLQGKPHKHARNPLLSYLLCCMCIHSFFRCRRLDTILHLCLQA